MTTTVRYNGTLPATYESGHGASERTVQPGDTVTFTDDAYAAQLVARGDHSVSAGSPTVPPTTYVLPQTFDQRLVNLEAAGFGSIAGVQRLFIVGHSIAAGGATSEVDRAWYNLAAGLLDAEVSNYARGGAVLAYSESNVQPYGAMYDGGYGHVLVKIPPQYPGVAFQRTYQGAYAAGTTYKANDCVFTGARGVGSRWWLSVADVNVGNDPTADNGTHWREITAGGPGTHPFMPSGRLPVMMFGLNDLGFHGDLDTFLHTARVVAASLRASEYLIRGYDPRITRTGAGWAAPATLAAGSAACGGVSGAAFPVAQNTTDVESILTPADWPGGYVTLTYAVFGRLTSGVFQSYVDGVASTAVDFSAHPCGWGTGALDGGKSAAWGIRVPVPAGAHEITVRQTTAWAGNFFTAFVATWTDAVYFEAQGGAPLVVAGLSKPGTDAMLATFYPRGFASGASIDTWDNAYKAMIAAEFPDALYWVQDAIRDHDQSKYYYDNIHLNDHGSAVEAVDLVQKLRPYLASFPREVIARMARAPREGNNTPQILSDYAGGAIPIGTSWQDVSYTSNLTGNPTRFIEASCRAESGDVIEVTLIATWNLQAEVGTTDIAVMTWPNGRSQAPVRGSYFSSGNGTQANNGIPGTGLNNGGIYAPVLTSPVQYIVQNSDLVNGQITVRPIFKSSGGTRSILFAGSNPIHFYIRNLGQKVPYIGAGASR